MRHRLQLSALGLLLAAAPAGAATLTIACGGAPGSFEACRDGAQAWAEARGQEIRVLRYPDSSTRARDLVAELLEAGVNDLDVVEADLVWSGTLAPHLVDLGGELKDEAAEHFVPAVAAFTVEGHLLAAPWCLSVGRLFYRSDLLAQQSLAPPRSWDELAAAARSLQERARATGGGDFSGYLWQGRVGEGLTANAVEWFASAGVPIALPADGSIAMDDPRLAQALSQAAGWIGTISPDSVLEMGGEQSLAAFIEGKAGFLRYWSNGQGLMEAPDSPVRGKIGVVDLPAGGGWKAKAGGVLGGFGLGVSRYGKERALALDLVRYLTSAEEEKRRALAGGLDPSRPALYDDPELQARHPGYPELRQALEDAVIRPAAQTVRRYDALSDAFASGVHDILQGGGDPGPGLAALGNALRRVGPDRRQPGS